MLIIIDKHLPSEAKRILSNVGQLMEFYTNDITYDAISGHPDIFFCQTPAGLIVAPNTPRKFLSMLTSGGITFTLGKFPVGNAYPETARYNAVVTFTYLIHNLAISDPVIHALTASNKTLTFSLSPLTLNQGYTRCNLLDLGGNQFITCDKGIEKTLLARGLDTQYLSPTGILLPGFENGFFGGCCGILDNKLFIAGNLDLYPAGDKVRGIVAGSGLEIIELYDGPLFDVGGIFFVPG